MLLYFISTDPEPEIRSSQIDIDWTSDAEDVEEEPDCSQNEVVQPSQTLSIDSIHTPTKSSDRAEETNDGLQILPSNKERTNSKNSFCKRDFSTEDSDVCLNKSTKNQFLGPSLKRPRPVFPDELKSETAIRVSVQFILLLGQSLCNDSERLNCICSNIYM